MRLADTDRLASLLLWSVALAFAGLLLLLAWDIVSRGAGRLDWGFLTGDIVDGGRRGGIAPVLINTVWVVGIALLVSLPLGLATALYLSEYTSERSPGGKLVRRSLDILAGIPSIVFGLFGAAAFSSWLGLGLSVAAGGLTLACMILPLFTRLSEAALQAVPAAYQQAAVGLGLRPATRLLRVVLPAAMPALLGAGVLSLGRALAETAALLFTSGAAVRLATGPTDAGRALPVHIYECAMNLPGGDAAAAASATVLGASLIVINASVRLLARWSRRHHR